MQNVGCGRSKPKASINSSFWARRSCDSIVSQFVIHYHGERPHQAKDNQPLLGKSPPEATDFIRYQDIICRKRLGGIVFEQEAGGGMSSWIWVQSRCGCASS